MKHLFVGVLLAGSRLFFGHPTWAAEPAGAGGAAVPSARVVMVHDPEATQAYSVRPARVQAMVQRGLLQLTGKSTLPAAWLSLVSTQDIIGIKVYSSPGPNSGTRPAVAAAVVEGLLAAHVPPTHIVIWDQKLVDLRLAGYLALGERYGVRVASSTDAGYDTNTFYEAALLGRLLVGDVEFGRKGEGVGRKSFVSRLVTQQLTKIIHLTPLLNHNEAGVSGNLFGLASGCVDNFFRFERDREHIDSAIPDIYALPVLGDRVVLNIVDALICQYEGGERGLLHYSTMLNQLRFSTDPVALDVLSLQELDRQRQAGGFPASKLSLEMYRNATLIELGVSEVRNIKVETAP